MFHKKVYVARFTLLIPTMYIEQFDPVITFPLVNTNTDNNSHIASNFK